MRKDEKLGSAQGVLESPIFAEATVGEDGSLHLNPPAASLKVGERVLLTISPMRETRTDVQTLLRGSVLRYDDPFGPSAPLEEWEALREC